MSDDLDPVMITRRDAKRISRLLMQSETGSVTPPNQYITRLRRSTPPPATWYWGKLASSMAAGTLEEPETFTVNVWVPDGESEDDPKPFIITTTDELLPVTVVNRSNITGNTGTVCKIEYMWGEWTLKWIDCP